MGGYGSGRRWSYCAKRTVEDCLTLDVNWMTREGLFDNWWGREGKIAWYDPRQEEPAARIGYEIDNPQQFIRLHYQTGGVRHHDYRVSLTSSLLPWGGYRKWFICPLNMNGVPCGRRVAKLYLPPESFRFGCRHCHDLTYVSCRTSRRFRRSWTRVDKEFGLPVADVLSTIKDQWQADSRMEKQQVRNEQRRRSRKARNRA